jgi:hypothetical protein
MPRMTTVELDAIDSARTEISSYLRATDERRVSGGVAALIAALIVVPLVLFLFFL